MQAFYDNKPTVLEAVGNGSYRYRYNIEEIKTGEGEETRTQWTCEEVTVWSPITSNKITEAVITEKWTSNYEQKLVNEYNAAKLGIYEESETYITRYSEYLKERESLKSQINSDCKTLGID